MTELYDTNRKETIDEFERTRECSQTCPHFDETNLCCWPPVNANRGICFDVREGDLCRLGYKDKYEP
jgi:hypothetical protein